jgi:hypothetical protein
MWKLPQIPRLDAVKEYPVYYKRTNWFSFYHHEWHGYFRFLNKWGIGWEKWININHGFAKSKWSISLIKQ